MKNKKMRDTPLQVAVTNGQLVIGIGVDVLAQALEFLECNNPFDEERNDFKRLYKVTNSIEFAEGVRRVLHAEREDGSNLMTDMFDKAMWDAIEDGTEGVEEAE